ncbi:hypothetical protein D4R42_00660 [bacterium]|nr:MAG: hypothetical protein D4R42_00660 [bacterium]
MSSNGKRARLYSSLKRRYITSEKSTVIAIMLFVLGVLALGLSLYPLTYWEYQLVQGDAYWDIAVEKVYPLQWIGEEFKR